MIQQGREYLSLLLLFCITQNNIYFFSYAFTVQFVLQICDIMFNIGDAKQISDTYSLPCESQLQSSYYLIPDSRCFLPFSLLNHSWNPDQNQNLLESILLPFSLLNHSWNLDCTQKYLTSIFHVLVRTQIRTRIYQRVSYFLLLVESEVQSRFYLSCTC